MPRIQTNTPPKKIQWLLMATLVVLGLFILWPILRELGYRSGDDAVALRVYRWRDELQLESLEQQYNLPKGLLSAVMHQESAGNPSAESYRGAKGLFQFMPPTAQDMGLNDRSHPQDSAQAAAKCLNMLYLRYNKNLELTLAAYNWGLGNVDQYIKPNPRNKKNQDSKDDDDSNYSQYRLTKMPNETQNYISRIKMLRTTYYLR